MKKFFAEFKEFISRGNVLDMAIGVIIATAFGKITTSLVNDVFMPFIGWIFGGVDLTERLNVTVTPAVLDEAGEVVKEANVLGIGTLLDGDYTRRNCAAVAENRDWTAARLRERGFTLPDSKANFLFAKTERMEGAALYAALKERGVLVRHFSAERIKDYNRVTIGTPGQMDILIENIRAILEA